MGKIALLCGPARAPFLLLTPACVALGVGTAYWELGHVSLYQVVLILVGALSAHVSVNAFNEYFDYHSGLDFKTARTPFSGGSGTLPAHPELARPTLMLSLTTLAVAAGIGIYFVWLSGWLLLPLGLLGLGLVLSYTIWWTQNPVLCLIAPGLGFGLLMVMGTHYCLAGSYSWTPFVASLAPTFLVSDLLLLNQFPDVEADRTVGRRHFPMTRGVRTASRIYGVFLMLAYVSIVVGVMLHLMPGMSLLALGTAVVAAKAYQRARQAAENIPELIPALTMNVVVNLCTPPLVALGLFIGGR